MLEDIRKGEIVPSWRFSEAMIIGDHFSIVLDVLTSRRPVVALPSTAHIGPESSLVKRVSFLEPENIEFYCHFSWIFYWEVIPLHMAVCIGIKAHVEIVFLRRNPQLHLYVPSMHRPNSRSRTCYQIPITFLPDVFTTFTPTLHLLATWKIHRKCGASFLDKYPFLWSHGDGSRR